MRYLSPRQLGRAIGVSESSIKRWIDAGKLPTSRTAGGHRRVALPDAVRFLRETGQSVHDAEALGLAAGDVLAGRARDEQITSALVELLMAGHDKAFSDALCQLYIDGRALHWIIDLPLRGAMSEIGKLWHTEGDGVGVEHRGMDMCLRALHELRAMVPMPRDDAPWAVGGAPPGDPYLLPSLCVGLVLAEAGWQTANLGPNVPWDQYRTMAGRYKAKLVWLSVTGQVGSDTPDQALALAEQLDADGAHLLVGGQSVPDQIAQAGRPNVHVVADMAGLTGAAAPLKQQLGATA